MLLAIFLSLSRSMQPEHSGMVTSIPVYGNAAYTTPVAEEFLNPFELIHYDGFDDFNAVGDFEEINLDRCNTPPPILMRQSKDAESETIIAAHPQNEWNHVADIESCQKQTGSDAEKTVCDFVDERGECSQPKLNTFDWDFTFDFSSPANEADKEECFPPQNDQSEQGIINNLVDPSQFNEYAPILFTTIQEEDQSFGADHATLGRTESLKRSFADYNEESLKRSLADYDEDPKKPKFGDGVYDSGNKRTKTNQTTGYEALESPSLQPVTFNSSNDGGISYTDIKIIRYKDLCKYFKSFHEMVMKMSKQPNFKDKLKRMVNFCRVDEKEIKNEILRHVSPKKNSTGSSYTKPLDTAVVLDDDLVELIADLIQNKYDTSVEIKNTAPFPKESIFLKHWNHSKRCISILKERHGAKPPKLFENDFKTKVWLFNDSFLRLIEDSIARLDLDFMFRHCVYCRWSDPLFPGSLIAYTTQTVSVFEFLEQNPRIGNELMAKEIIKIEKNGEKRSKCVFTEFGNVICALTEGCQAFNEMQWKVKECDVFATIIFARSRIICETYYAIVNLFSQKKIHAKNACDNGELQSLILYTFLDFRKVEEFRRPRYPSMK